MLWHCWLGIRKSIRPVKIEWFFWGVDVVICLERGADCFISSRPLHPKAPSSLVSLKSTLILPLWYRLTQVVLEKRPLNRCSSSRNSIFQRISGPHHQTHTHGMHTGRCKNNWITYNSCDSISGTINPNFTEFSVHVACGHGLVPNWRRCNTYVLPVQQASHIFLYWTIWCR